MVHSLIPISVDIKIRTFEEPARLINNMELACAIGMAFAQAKLPMPESRAGIDLKEFWKETEPQIRDHPAVNESLKKVIADYIFRKGEILDEDSVLTLRLGYEFS